MAVALQILAQSTIVGMLVSPSGSDSSPPPTWWAGHHVTLGSRWIPFKGRVRTRMDSFVLARGKWVDGRWLLVQETCAVQFSKVAGVRVRMDARHLPRSTFSFTPTEGSSTLEGRSRVVWNDEDVDGDGKPGMTVRVEARVCSGALHVANDSSTRAAARFSDQGFGGFSHVRVEQRVLGAEGACLSVVADDTDERFEGPFAFVPVPEGTQCRDLPLRDWPVDALKFE
jgi:hypothetical protein